MGQWVTADGRGAVDVDVRYYPYLITTWWGVTDRVVVDASFDAMDEASRKAQREGRRIVSVSNVAKPGMPNAVTRRHMAERTKRTNELFAGVNAGSVVVIKSNVSRAGLRAIQWLMGTDDSMVVVAALDEAFARAAQMMEAVGETGPRLPDAARYQPRSPLSESA